MSKERAQTFHTDQVSLWNFCGRSSDFNSQGYQWWSRKMSAIFTDYFGLRFFLFSWDRLRLLFFSWNLKKILKIVIIFAEISGSLTHSVPGCPCSKTSSPQCPPQLSRSSLFSGPSRRGAGVMYTGDTSMRVHECCCCCCNEDLLKLQVTRLVLCLRCWTTWRQKQKGEETKQNARQVSFYVYVTKSDNHFRLCVWFRSYIHWLLLGHMTPDKKFPAKSFRRAGNSGSQWVLCYRWTLPAGAREQSA